MVNFQKFQVAELIKSNEDDFISVEEVSIEELDKLRKYDAVLVWGMGMRITAEQRELIQKAASKTAIYTMAATNPENNICSIDSLKLKIIKEYIDNGGSKNNANLFRYIRKEIDRKKFFVVEPEAPTEKPSDVLYYLDKNKYFKTVVEFEEYLRQEKIFRLNAPKIAIIGGMSDPFGENCDNLDSLILSFQRSGVNVYPVASMMKRLAFLQEINPDAVIYMPHGRLSMMMPDAAVKWFKERNIPLFGALTTMQPADEWTKDPQGMMGGFLSQSVVMPELDGAIYPYVINAQYVDKNGLYLFKTIPERLKSFTRLVNNFISLKKKNNADKRVAIYYFKGVGQQTLTAQGLETVPSLYNLLKKLKVEGYKVDNLPENEKAFEALLQKQGSVLGAYAKGAFDNFLKNGNPALIEKHEYEAWIKQSLPDSLYNDVVKNYGEAPGDYMSVSENGKNYLAVARIQLGNIVLLPQPMAGLGDDAFKIVHGTKLAPPHTYIASYLWTQYGFKADVMIHFGTHGSLEFTPSKQVALSNNDWPDRLVGTVPHFYYYSIGNVGESMMAKRRSYATLVSYLTPPFMESNMRGMFASLNDRIRAYNKASENDKNRTSLAVKKVVVQMGLHRDLKLDSILNKPYTAEQIEQIDNFAEEIANEKIVGHLYTTGVLYEKTQIQSTVMAMSADPIAYSLAALDKQRKRVTDAQLKNKVFFTDKYLNPAKRLVNQVLAGKRVDSTLICSVAGISTEELTNAHNILKPKKGGMAAMMQGGNVDTKNMDSRMKEAVKKGKHPSWVPKIGSSPGGATKTLQTQAQPVQMPKPDKNEPVKEQKQYAQAIVEVERTLNNIVQYKKSLENSPQVELDAIINALNGGYVAPSSGGDAVANPSAIPTGRNLYAVNAESTPSENAWYKGVELAKATIEQYRKQHNAYPHKVSYTFWSSEFIESEGATIAQVLYMLGVEPVRDAFGRVTDLRLIPSAELGRPRIDIVVQTSGQFRDLAASRLALINRAVEMAAASTGDKYENQVTVSAVETERQLVEQGMSPKEARELSTARVFGGVNGNYGTGIMGMVERGDRWENESEIADVYLNNMGAIYGSEKDWGKFNAGLLRAVLHNTNVVIQPRQNNTWGALSLDHVYEFMGGMNLTVRQVTGKDPESYFADYRNRNNVRIQDLKEAVGVEARSTIFNPTYIKEQMKGGASSASQFSEVIKNTYGWNVMKPSTIDNEMWNKIYSVYVKDEYNLNVQEFFKSQNPAALEEMTGIMMESARKGMWKASPEQLKVVAELHTDIVKQFGASGGSFTAQNSKLQDYISQKVDNQAVASVYKKQMQQMLVSSSDADQKQGVTMKKQKMQNQGEEEKTIFDDWVIIGVVLMVFIGLIVMVRQRRKK